MEPNNQPGSVPATGSPQSAPSPTPDQGQPGGKAETTGGDQSGTNDKSKDYDDLASRFGTQGQELGEYRQFFQNISPLLDKLDTSPEMVQAIIDGKIDKDLTKAVIEGRIDIKEAEAVDEAQKTVEKKMGTKAFKEASPEDVSKKVEAEMLKFRKEFEDKADLQSFQEYSQKFIEKTKDFEKYADDVDKWLDSHDVTDIEIAYYAVKGQLSEAEAKKEAEEASSERSKEVLANASGGGQTAQFSQDGTPMVDTLIAGKPSPNSFLGG